MTTYEYSAGPSVFMSGDSDWIIRETGKPGIVASIVGRESHAQAAVHALSQAARLDLNRAEAVQQHATRLAAALWVTLYDMHTSYGCTSRTGGTDGSIVTPWCHINDPHPQYEHLSAGALMLPLREYVDRYGPDIRAAARELLKPPPPEEGT